MPVFLPRLCAFRMLNVDVTLDQLRELGEPPNIVAVRPRGGWILKAKHTVAIWNLRPSASTTKFHESDLH